MKQIVLLLLLSYSAAGYSQTRTEILLDKNWKFTRVDDSLSYRQNYNDSKWQNITVPHDWAIYGPFDKFNDLQQMAIVQDGQKEALPHAGRTGGLPFVGAGWYRNTFTIPGFMPGKKVSLIFDGAMSNAQVYVNGKLAGQWPYGYNSFHFDISNLVLAGQPNTIAVRLNNFTESSRWYPGAGIYRNVHLRVTEGAHIPVWGTQIVTPVIKDDYAIVQMTTRINLPDGTNAGSYSLHTVIVSPDGKIVAENKNQLDRSAAAGHMENLTVTGPQLWDVNHPLLYKAVSHLYRGSEKVDEYTTVFGIRTITIVPDKGFYLNGKLTKFKGVCNHHDLGPLGSAVNDAAIRRQVRIMKEMGVNAIRTSHNMPAPELVRACDEMGMMLMIETFDEWKQPKMKNGYNLFFDEWVEKDLTNVIHQFRNNPSVVMWCIGNEVPDQGTPNGPALTRRLQEICHREDPTRPVTNGMDYGQTVINNGVATLLDVAGFNYRVWLYKEGYAKLSQKLILGSETVSTVSSRGVYKFPVVRKSMAQYPDHQSSSYDVEHCSWSDLPEDNFIQHDDLSFTMGEFVWTGFDYLGEPTPYYTDWPSHSSLFGIVDLAGIPKDRYYLYRSHWNKTENTLHVLPHWNWKGKEGDTIPVFVYTNHPSAELFINGRSQGKMTKDTTIKQWNTDNIKDSTLQRQKRYRLMWMNTIYEPGELKVVAFNSSGAAVADTLIRTAGKPAKILLTADRQKIKADGKDLSFINVKLLDKNGNFCPTETREINFKVKGAGSFRAVANGNSISLESFQQPKMKLFSGQLTAIVQSSDKAGTLILEASASGLRKASIAITTE